MQGDENCLFCAFSVSRYGNEKNHSSLKSLISKHTINNHVKLAEALGRSSSDTTIKKIVKSLSITNTWAGKDTILIACDFLAREIHIHFAVDASSFFVCAPVTCKSLYRIIALAHYESCYYLAVSSDKSDINNNKYTVVSRTESARQLRLPPFTEFEHLTMKTNR